MHDVKFFSLYTQFMLIINTAQGNVIMANAPVPQNLAGEYAAAIENRIRLGNQLDALADQLSAKGLSGSALFNHPDYNALEEAIGEAESYEADLYSTIIQYNNGPEIERQVSGQFGDAGSNFQAGAVPAQVPLYAEPAASAATAKQNISNEDFWGPEFDIDNVPAPPNPYPITDEEAIQQAYLNDLQEIDPYEYQNRLDNYAAEQQRLIDERLAAQDGTAMYDVEYGPANDPNLWYDDSLGEYVPRDDRPEDWEARDQNAFVYNDDLGEWVPREDMPDNWQYGADPQGGPEYDEYGCRVGLEVYDDTDGVCVPIGETSNYLGNPLPVDERDENGCLIGSEYYDDETMECVPIGTTPNLYDPITVAAEQAYAKQRSIKDARKTINRDDWRFRVRLSPFADYLYNSSSPGILAPLRDTDGVIFPYMPQITVSSNARYQSYDLTHSNYRGYFYSGSHVENIVVNAEFTAQDTAEANYLLATMHFFKSATKMFYGQDRERGTPPPLLYMTGLGEYQFNEHPCALTVFQYTLPDNVDYIKTSNSTTTGDQYLGRNTSGGYQGWSSALSRLITSGLDSIFGSPQVLGPISSSISGLTKVTGGDTYVPTRINLSLTFLPINTRNQISKDFSLREFANGNLIKKGIW